MIFIKNKSGGFTLAETIVTIFIFGILMMGTTLMLRDILSNSKQKLLAIDNIDKARRIGINFIDEIRNSNYGANGAYPLGQAGDSQIIFFSNTLTSNGAPSRIRYYFAGNTLYKGVTKVSASGTSYDTSTEVITALLTSLSLGSNPLFYYYDGSYDGSGTALSQPVNINNVKFVKINLTVLKQDSKNSASVFTINAGSAIRNLKTNLGN